MANNGHAGKFEWVRSALEQYEGPLLRYAHRIVGDLERARDVVQDTFMRLCRQSQPDLDGHLPEWLYTVCRNRALDVRRKENRMATITTLEGPAETETSYRLAEPESREISPNDAAEQDESHQQVLELLSELTENQQECIRLKFQNSLSYREIAEVTGLSVSNVGYLIHTGLKKVRQKLMQRQV